MKLPGSAMPGLRLAVLAALLSTLASSAQAQEDGIRQVLSARLKNLPEITSVMPSPIPGLYEVVAGGEIFYSDADGSYIVQGAMIQTRNLRNITQQRLGVVNAIPFDQLPIQNAIVTRIGSGARKMVVFADPNCGYCKQLVRNTQSKLTDVTIYTVVIAILAPDSRTKARDILCSSDPSAAWTAWMGAGVLPPSAPPSCTPKALDENIAYATAKHVFATPTLFFTTGRRVAAAIGAEQAEALLKGQL